MDDRALLLSAVSGLAQAPSTALESLAEHCTMRRYAAKAVIFPEGAAAIGLWVLAHGQVALTRAPPPKPEEPSWRDRLRPQPDPPEVGRVSPGQLFGVVGAVSWGRNLVTATTLGSVAALEVPLWRFREIYGSDSEEAAPYLRRAILIALGRSVREREQRASRLVVDLGRGVPSGQEPSQAPPIIAERPSGLRR